MPEAQTGLTLALALAVGVFVQSLARQLGIPGIVLLLLAGAALGPDLLGWIDPGSLGAGLFAIVDLAVAVILFEGALNLEISRLRREQAAIRRLVTWGALVTLLGGALAARACLGWPWERALLFGSLVVVTGPTVVGPLVRGLRLRPKLATVLEAEGVLIDPIGAILAVVMLEIALAPGAESLRSGAGRLVVRLGFGALAGVGGGTLLAYALRSRHVVPEGLGNIFVLACVLLLFEGCDALVPHSGIVAVTAAGVVVGNLRSPLDRDLREFKDQLTVMLIGLLFVLLAATVRLDDVKSLGWGGAAVVASLVCLVRPAGVALSTLGSALSWRERAFVGWLAPRGIVAAAVASLTASALEASVRVDGALGGAGLEGAAESGAALRALVFLTIAVTVVLAGVSAAPLASWLGLRLPGRDTVAVLGAQGLGLELARILKRADVPVVLLDSNPVNCRRAEELSLTVVYGDALQERTILRARPESVGVVIGATPNQMLNGIFVSRTRERFGVPVGYVAVERPGQGLAPELVESETARMLFEGPHDVERWDVRSRHDEVAVERWVFRGEKREEAPGGEEAPEEPPRPVIGERLVILTVERAGKTAPMHADFGLREGDVATVALHRAELDEARELLAALGFAPEDASEAAGAAPPPA